MSTSAPTPTTTRRRATLALLLLVPAPSVGVIAAMIAWPGGFGKIVFGAAKIWMFCLPAAWHLLVDRARPSLSPPRGGFGLAIALGVLMSATIVASYWLLGPRWIDVEHVRAMAARNGIGTVPSYLGLAAYWILVNSVLEEYVYRWFIFRKLEVLMPAAAAVLGSAACFTLHHVIALKVQFGWNVTILASLGIFIGGAVWSWLYLRYHSIWPAYASHAIVDVAVFGLGWMIIFG